MLAADNDHKKALRKVRGVAGKLQDHARHCLNKGCLDQGAYIQFGSDLQTYNLYEALLYAYSYEEAGHYVKGTTQTALNEVIGMLNDKGNKLNPNSGELTL